MNKERKAGQDWNDFGGVSRSDEQARALFENDQTTRQAVAGMGTLFPGVWDRRTKQTCTHVCTRSGLAALGGLGTGRRDAT